MIDFGAIIRDIDGEPTKRPGSNGAADTLVDTTLGWLVRTVLAQDQVDDRNELGDAKITRIALAMRIPPDGEMPLSAEEISLIRRRAGATVSGIAFYRLTELIDPAALGAPRQAEPPRPGDLSERNRR